MFIKNALCFTLLLFLIITASNTNSKAQIDTTNSTLPIQKTHSPTKATLLSTFVPGAGQIYNKKYWKVPFVYGGLIAFGIAIKNNSDEYELYRKAYVYKVDEDSTTIDNFVDLSADIIKSRRDIFRRNRDLSIISLSLVYVLQVIDAHVDAHLFTFDVDENLSFNIAPQAIPIQNSFHPGVTFTLNIKK